MKTFGEDKDLEYIISVTELPKIDINVKLIWGEKDVIVPLSIGEEANNKFKDSQLTVFKDAGHNMLRRKSNEITKIIKEL